MTGPTVPAPRAADLIEGLGSMDATRTTDSARNSPAKDRTAEIYGVRGRRPGSNKGGARSDEGVGGRSGAVWRRQEETDLRVRISTLSLFFSTST